LYPAALATIWLGSPLVSASAARYGHGFPVHPVNEMQISSPELIDSASRAFKSVLDQLAPTDATVLIIGETGTGKEVMARYLHHHSAVVCNVLIYSEIFYRRPDSRRCKRLKEYKK